MEIRFKAKGLEHFVTFDSKKEVDDFFFNEDIEDEDQVELLEFIPSDEIIQETMYVYDYFTDDVYEAIDFKDYCKSVIAYEDVTSMLHQEDIDKILYLANLYGNDLHDFVFHEGWKNWDEVNVDLIGKERIVEDLCYMDERLLAFYNAHSKELMDDFNLEAYMDSLVGNYKVICNEDYSDLTYYIHNQEKVSELGSVSYKLDYTDCNLEEMADIFGYDPYNGGYSEFRVYKGMTHALDIAYAVLDELGVDLSLAEFFDMDKLAEYRTLNGLAFYDREIDPDRGLMVVPYI